MPASGGNITSTSGDKIKNYMPTSGGNITSTSGDEIENLYICLLQETLKYII